MFSNKVATNVPGPSLPKLTLKCGATKLQYMLITCSDVYSNEVTINIPPK
uniref:Uncharacterized protein n=1 Tax=Arion vulgaris TaxID=1028688 RepID=A0A0B7B657_9EUPU